MTIKVNQWLISPHHGEHRRSLQREAQHIGHFVGIDKDDWMCSSVLIVSLGWFGSLETLFLSYKAVSVLEIYAMCYSLEISIYIYLDDKKAMLFW